MTISDDNDRELPCFRDNATVPADSPRCLHPSSFCEFRESCPIRAAEQHSQRGAKQGQQVIRKDTDAH
jgi:hypothetical protein